MNNLPLILDAEEAVEYFRANDVDNDALLSYIVGILSKDGYSNQAIRETLHIPKVYTVTHLKRAGISLSKEDLSLWFKNPQRITLGHVRAIAKLPSSRRNQLLRDLLAKRLSVRELEALAKGKTVQSDADIRSFERTMEDTLGREVNLKFNNATKCGTVSLGFYGLDDLESILDGLKSALKTN